MKRVKSILSLALVALLVFALVGCGSAAMSADEIEVKELVVRDRYQGVSDAEYVQHLETINNGYQDYSYYNLEARVSGNYIVEVKETENGKQLYWVIAYESGQKNKKLEEMKTYRLSPEGYKSDALEAGDITANEFFEMD